MCSLWLAAEAPSPAVSSWGRTRPGSSLGNGCGGGPSLDPAVYFEVGMREVRIAGGGWGPAQSLTWWIRTLFNQRRKATA